MLCRADRNFDHLVFYIDSGTGIVINKERSKLPLKQKRQFAENQIICRGWSLGSHRGFFFLLNNFLHPQITLFHHFADRFLIAEPVQIPLHDFEDRIHFN